MILGPLILFSYFVMSSLVEVVFFLLTTGVELSEELAAFCDPS